MRARKNISPILGALAWMLILCALSWSAPASATPAFAQQTGEPCSQCHVGAFGPQLKPEGRDFKLFGYVNGDGKNTLPPIAIIGLTSFTRTKADQSSAPGAQFGTNDNTAVDQVNLLYTGKLIGGVGTFAEVTYDGVRRAFTIDNIDVKRTFDIAVGDRHLLLGLDVNNRPTVQDLWNSTPTWGFPYNASALAPTPSGKAIIDGALAQRVVGGGAYAMWDDLLYVEFNAYSPIANRTLRRLGVSAPAGSDVYDGPTPYWRVALEHQFADAYLEVGGYGISAKRFPGGDRSAGGDKFTDVALDGTFQYAAGARHYISTHATWIHEDETLVASQALSGSRASNHLDTVRGDFSYSYDNTWTPSVQLFRTTGSTDPVFFSGAGGSPNSDGYVVELAYVPFGKSNSPVSWANARFTAQWVAYTRFDGARRGASDNNTLFLSARVALAPFGALIRR